METRELRYFIAVAEESHVGRAAERLGMAQPPLSRAIAQLERRIGAHLFVRSPRGMTLTIAGQTLLREGRPALAAVEAAERRTRRTIAAAGHRGWQADAGRPCAKQAATRRHQGDARP